MTTRDPLIVALRDALTGLESVLRNETILADALNRSGLPSLWLRALAPKADRARAALAKAEREAAR